MTISGLAVHSIEIDNLDRIIVEPRRIEFEFSLGKLHSKWRISSLFVYSKSGTYFLASPSFLVAVHRICEDLLDR